MVLWNRFPGAVLMLGRALSDGVVEEICITTIRYTSCSNVNAGNHYSLPNVGLASWEIGCFLSKQVRCHPSSNRRDEVLLVLRGLRTYSGKYLG
jgi:hypothetical protein